MEIVDNRGVLLRVRNPALITQVIPKSSQLDDHEVLVHWGLQEMQVLKNLQIKNVPSPILGRYAWPGLFAPLEHQKKTAAFLTLHNRAFCFNEQGTGKTAAAIWAADYLMTLGLVHRVLIICPLSITQMAWMDELFRVAMHRSAGIAYGTAKVRNAVVNSGNEFVIVNFDGLEIIETSVIAGGFDLIIVDEANAFKNVSTNRWKSLNRIMRQLSCRLWMMTGTPAAQSPLDAYGLAKLVNPAGVPRYAGAFKDLVMIKVSQFKWTPRKEAPQLVFDALQPAIRFTKEECLDLPEMTYTQRKIELTPQQKKYYELIKDRMVATAAGETVTALNAAILMTKLLQISCGAVYTDEGKSIEFDISHRYKALLEVIDESSKKVLVFVPFRHVILSLLDKLSQDGYTVDTVHGKIGAKMRDSVFYQFQHTEHPRILLLQPQTTAHGITLTAANTVVWWGPVPSLETYAQANARVHRNGQDSHCTVIQLVGSKVEDKMYKMLDSKIDIHEEMLALYDTIKTER